MNEYTPTTEEVRNRFTFYSSGIPHPEFEAQFDRWLAAHQSKVAEAERERILNLIQEERGAYPVGWDYLEWLIALIKGEEQ